MATRPQAVQLRHPEPVRAKRRKMGNTRKLGRRGVLGRGILDNERRNVGIQSVKPLDWSIPEWPYEM